MSEPVPVTEVAPPLANFKALATGPKGSLHTALGVDHGVPLPEDLLAHAAEHHEDSAIRTRAQMVLEIKRWRASKNKYLEKVAETLEKVALNSFTAREMAKRVGVIVDSNSNWKYALRNLRDGMGEPLQGRERREALNRLAGGRDLLREHQQMAAAQRKVRDVDEVQQVNIGNKVLVPPTVIRGKAHLTNASESTDALNTINLRDFEAKIIPHLTKGNLNRLSLSHVHPFIHASQPKVRQLVTQMPASDLADRFAKPNLTALAAPSGGDAQSSAFRHMSKTDRARALSGNRNMVGMDEGLRTQDLKLHVDSRNAYYDELSNLTNTQKAARSTPSDGDKGVFINSYPGVVNVIHSPSTGVVGLHKVVVKDGFAFKNPVSSRSVYLDLQANTTA